MTLEATETRMIQIPASAFEAIRGSLAASGGSGAEASRQFGVQVGAMLIDLVRERAGGDDLATIGTGRFWSVLEELLREMGWGETDHEQPHAAVVSLSSSDWFEAEGRHTAHPSCQFTVGVLGELFRQVAGLDVAVLEVECRAAGDRHCRFLVGGADALSNVFSSLREGEGYRAALAALG